MAIPPKVKRNLRMTEAQWARVEALAEREEVSINTLLVQAVENYLPFRERHWAQMAARRPVKPVAERGRAVPKVGVNEPCPCGSGLKYKRCHGQA